MKCFWLDLKDVRTQKTDRSSKKKQSNNRRKNELIAREKQMEKNSATLPIAMPDNKPVHFYLLLLWQPINKLPTGMAIILLCCLRNI